MALICGKSKLECECAKCGELPRGQLHTWCEHHPFHHVPDWCRKTGERCTYCKESLEECPDHRLNWDSVQGCREAP